MHTWLIVLIVVVVAVALVAAAAVGALGRRRTGRLRDRYGDEYDRTVAATGNRRRAEADLMEREKQRGSLQLRPVTPEMHSRYSAAWTAIERGFIDSPQRSALEADHLVHGLMREIGYPEGDRAETARLLSVDHPEAVQGYRDAGRALDSGRGDTEAARQAVLAHRVLMIRLLGGREVRGEAQSMDAARGRPPSVATPPARAETPQPVIAGQTGEATRTAEDGHAPATRSETEAGTGYETPAATEQAERPVE